VSIPASRPRARRKWSDGHHDDGDSSHFTTGGDDGQDVIERLAAIDAQLGEVLEAASRRSCSRSASADPP
jgi:hypothetical protein